MLKINGAEMPAPTSLQVGIMDISKAERNARGTMIIERIATKRKLEMAWEFLSDSEQKKLLNAVSGVFFTVEYIDPETTTKKTGTFYCGDRAIGAMQYQNGSIRWKDVSFNVIER